MSIPVLVQVNEEVRRLSIAGSAVAPGDFRLRKLIAPLEQAGTKAAIFAKVAQAVTDVVNSTEKSAAEPLLELSTLVNAILYTQGETGLAGKLEVIATTDFGQQYRQTSARVLQELLAALSSSGSGRFDIIWDAYHKGLFHDPRLVGPAVAAINDPYQEIADFVATTILPQYGKTIAPALREKLNVKGKSTDARRLRALHAVDPEGSRDIIRQAIEEGSKEIKIAAIGCLKNSPADLPLLLEQSKVKNREVRLAALHALALSDAAEAVAVICQWSDVAQDRQDIEPILTSQNPNVLGYLRTQIRQVTATALADKSKDRVHLGELANRLSILLTCLEKRKDRETEQLFLELFEHRDRLRNFKTDSGHRGVVSELCSLMNTKGLPRAQRALVAAHTSLEANELSYAFSAAVAVFEPGKVFELFGDYLCATPEDAKRNAISEWIEPHLNWAYMLAEREGKDSIWLVLDPRWLDVAVKITDEDLVGALARPGHYGAQQLLGECFDKRMKKNDLSRAIDTLKHMARAQHPEAVLAAIKAIKAYSKYSNYGQHWVGEVVSKFPLQSLSALEAIGAEVSEKMRDTLSTAIAERRSHG